MLGAPAGIRIPDTLIKSQVLYRLSYRGIFCAFLPTRLNIIAHFIRFVNSFKKFFQKMKNIIKKRFGTAYKIHKYVRKVYEELSVSTAPLGHLDFLLCVLSTQKNHQKTLKFFKAVPFIGHLICYNQITKHRCGKK